mmetsp:Transcript_33424/g.70240  ORF Transcript_33424/g.70240 Transcript_33424/m.70240 type:complete len:110 (+) Transcript_33424:705-1034(+)
MPLPEQDGQIHYLLHPVKIETFARNLEEGETLFMEIAIDPSDKCLHPRLTHTDDEMCFRCECSFGQHPLSWKLAKFATHRKVTGACARVRKDETGSVPYFMCNTWVLWE